MQLGEIQPGVIRTMRYFRGSSVIRNHLDQIGVEINPKGGIAVLFEINYNSGMVRAAVSITRDGDDADQFSKAEGRARCEAKFNAGDVIKFKHDKDFSLMECLYGHLANARVNCKVLTPFKRTLFTRIRDYTFMNQCAEELFDDVSLMMGVEDE
jgi:hypothetical protein